MDFVQADRNTWMSNFKTVDGQLMVLVATQKSRRTRRKGKTKYIYRLQGTNNIYWNRSRGGTFFMAIARSQDMKYYYDVFVQPPLTTKEKEWLDLYDYVLTVN